MVRVHNRFMRLYEIHGMNTTSTLIRELPVELEVLLWSRQFLRVQFNEFSALRMLSSAVTGLHNARSKVYGTTGRYLMANEGIYSLCLGSMYLHGILPLGQEGYRALVIQLASERMKLPYVDRDKLLLANERFEELTYQNIVPVEHQAVVELLALGDKAMRQAQYIYPDWFS